MLLLKSSYTCLKCFVSTPTRPTYSCLFWKLTPGPGARLQLPTSPKSSRISQQKVSQCRNTINESKTLRLIKEDILTAYSLHLPRYPPVGCAFTDIQRFSLPFCSIILIIIGQHTPPCLIRLGISCLRHLV